MNTSEVLCDEPGRDEPCAPELEVPWPPRRHNMCASPELSHGGPAPWLSTQQIADRFDELTRERVGYFVSQLGIADMKTHWHLGRDVREYSPEAVGLIELEARSRGYTRRASKGFDWAVMIEGVQVAFTKRDLMVLSPGALVAASFRLQDIEHVYLDKGESPHAPVTQHRVKLKMRHLHSGRSHPLEFAWTERSFLVAKGTD